MNYVSVENIAKSYGELELFSEISFGINQGQKIGLIAKNGTGKTSLLHILSQNETPDKGQVNYRKNLKMGFLPQEPNLDLTLSVEESILASENQILKIISRYEKALKNLPTGKASTEDNEEAYQKAFEEMEAANAWDFETQYKQILSKLGLDDLQKKVGTLSGGQKKRLALAIVLLERPDLLILDEPTNHLDLEMIEWLEDYFKKGDFALFMVTHDRYFLERACNEILELDEGNLYTYKGNYAYYLDKKEARMESERTHREKIEQLYKKELEWMRRQPKARTTKSKSRISDFDEIKARAQQRRNEHAVQLEINMERMGSKVVEMHNISKYFDDKFLFKNFSYSFQRGERLGIIGKNGTGKSTFLNILTGKIKPDSGKIVIGETIKFGYYTQKGIRVKEGQKVIDVIREYGDYIPLKKGRQISAQQLLERFLFDRKKQYDYVEKLSGGEQKRLYLCTVLIQNPNFLILDEPTNDLDIVTLNVLENFLLDFPGCLVVVSHDRYFMDKITDHLFVFQNGEIHDFPGNYSDYRAYEGDRFDLKDKKETASQKPKKITKKKAALSYLEKREYQNLEKEIADLEKEKKRLQQLFQTELSISEIEEKSRELHEVDKKIEEKTERWFELSVKAEE
ncbi:MAG TPA: ABC-F family ATP-binding cassette domain-containing protein [Flavobacteriaceae bacterium]|nr:ABC-F family ATP-binding cassette domain-containing protein [Flavobacteriaceae bacterium]